MLLTKTVMVKWSGQNKNWYVGKGYIFTKFKDLFQVSVDDLTKGTEVQVLVKCDCPDCENPIMKYMGWEVYNRYLHEDNKYYCNKCATKLFARSKMKKTRLLNSNSFKQWCNDNLSKEKFDEILNRWDYTLNINVPDEVSYGSDKKYWFKCPKGLHPSELKSINHFVNRQGGELDCNMCSSFAQWGIDNFGKDFLEKYWDYNKNKNTNPWKISYGTNKKIWIRCQEKDYHGSYYTIGKNFTKGERCPYCTNKNGIVHPLDSLGKIKLEDRGLLHLWSDKNKKSSYDYAPMSNKEAWWKCENGHEDYKRSINSSTNCGFRCPECQFSRGETKISKHLIYNNFIKTSQKEYDNLNDADKQNNKYYIPQKEFDRLLGLGGGNLSYDFYLPQLNMLIEYQGQQHEKYIRGFHKSKKDFEQQQEHDRRKRQYAEDHKIKLLEIWYWDFDYVEKILDKALKSNNKIAV